MDKNLEVVFDYHEQTKHSYSRYARSLGFMDWENQPDPYRSYRGAMDIELPIMRDIKTPPYNDIFSDTIPAEILNISSISQFLQFSMGLAAVKSDGFNEWALRCNASSGNLHPSEAYLILPPIKGMKQKSTISHYAPKDHYLEIIGEFDTDLWSELPKGSFFISVSSIVYREVWKYGERAFRYCLLDAGHAAKSLQISAKTLGWKYSLICDLEDEQISRIFGLDDKTRFDQNELETPEMLFLVSPSTENTNKNYVNILKDIYPNLDTKAKNIARHYQSWPLINSIEDATFSGMQKTKREQPKEIKRECTKESKDVILQRRSAQIMNKDDNKITYKQFYTLLQSSYEGFAGIANVVNLVIFAHNIETLEQGLYIFVRDKKQLDTLKLSMDSSFLWKECDRDLYLLREEDFRNIARNISCSQAIASDSAFSLGMLAHFRDEIMQKGAHRYKELYWECGAIGQQLYLEATSLDLSATGIGCFLDDVFHKLLGLESNRFQSLYHFTIGRAIRDKRILTKQPYDKN